MSYADIIEAVDNMPLNKQIQFVELIKKKIIDKKREIILKESKIALQDYYDKQLIEESAESMISRLSDLNK